MEQLHQIYWGRLVEPRDSWREFNERSVEGARNNLGNLLPIDDYYKVKSLIESTSKADEKYLLHGDTGVHNFSGYCYHDMIAYHSEIPF